jgi:hypothetical protein
MNQQPWDPQASREHRHFLSKMESSFRMAFTQMLEQPHVPPLK